MSNNSHSESYKAAGVDVTAGYKAVELMKGYVKNTYTTGVLGGIGGFGGAFVPNLAGMKEPVLVSGTDGVGTKLKLAFLMDKHDTIGIDCVAMCANDIACMGAKPLFFLDYVALGKNVPERVAEIVRGVCDGCVMADCALLGGETAEMPGFYPVDEYDLAGFCVGIVDRVKMINPENVKLGDALIGVRSSGVHSNGFSLVRKIFGVTVETLDEYYPELGKKLGEELLTPTKIYVKALNKLTDEIKVHGISHITGGGFYENIPRMLPDGLCARVKKDSYKVPEIFKLMQEKGKIPEHDMYNTFNMGVGLVMALDKKDAHRAMEILNFEGEEAFILGEVTVGEGVITL